MPRNLVAGSLGLFAYDVVGFFPMLFAGDQFAPDGRFKLVGGGFERLEHRVAVIEPVFEFDRKLLRGF